LVFQGTFKKERIAKMHRQKTMFKGIAVIVFVALLASPALAHRKYRITPQDPTRWGLQRHSHSLSESAKTAATTQSKTKGFDLLGGAADIITGTLETLSNTVEAVFAGKADSTGQTQKEDSRKGSSPHRDYRFVLKHAGGPAKWVRKR
jgi:hypothetical protein